MPGCIEPPGRDVWHSCSAHTGVISIDQALPTRWRQCRLGVISGWSVYPKLNLPLKINISIHNWRSKKICSIRYTQYVHVSFWTLRKWLYLRPQHSTRSPPPKAADFFGCFFRLLYRCFLDFQDKRYTCRLASYLMEHIFFEAQLYSEILIFKEKFNFWYTDHPEKPALSD